MTSVRQREHAYQQSKIHTCARQRSLAPSALFLQVLGGVFSLVFRGCCQMNRLNRRAIWWTTQTVLDDLWIAPVVHTSLVIKPRVTWRTFELMFECVT